VDVRWLAFTPDLSGKKTARVERIVIPRQQIDGDFDIRHHFTSFEYGTPIDLIALENVSGNNDELTSLIAGNAPKIADSVEPRRVPPGLRIGVEKAARYAELPITGVQKTRGHASPL
jgi:hypothetical protein